jgi:hypothetical protein
VQSSVFYDLRSHEKGSFGVSSRLGGAEVRCLNCSGPKKAKTPIGMTELYPLKKICGEGRVFLDDRLIATVLFIFLPFLFFNLNIYLF